MQNSAVKPHWLEYLVTEDADMLLLLIMLRFLITNQASCSSVARTGRDANIFGWVLVSSFPAAKTTTPVDWQSSYVVI